MRKKGLLILASALVLCLSTTTLATTVSTTSNQTVAGINTALMYKVRPGDTLNAIAARAQVPVSDIQLLYQQNSGQITPGDLLIFINEYQTNDYTWFKYQNLLSQSSYIMTVKPGQTLSGIAAQYGVNPSDLIILYARSANVLNPGDKILLPVPKNTDRVQTSSVRLITDLYYQVQPGDSIDQITNYLHMPNNLLQQLNPGITNQNIRQGQMLYIGNVYAQLYTVQPGDTLLGIAQSFNASPTDMAVIYRSNPNYLNPGDKILINIQRWANTSQSSNISANTSSASQNAKSSVGNQIQYVSATYSSDSDNSFSSNSAQSSGSSSGTPQTQQQLVAEYSNQYNVNPNLIFAIIKAESGFNPYALSPANCYGLMQLSLPTARLFDKSINSQNIYDPETNIRIGVKYFKLLLNQFNNNLVCAIAAYNAGSQNVVNWLQNNPNLSISDIPFYATRQYVQAVLTFYNQYQQSGLFNSNSSSTGN